MTAPPSAPPPDSRHPGAPAAEGEAAPSATSAGVPTGAGAGEALRFFSVADVARIFALTESRIRYWDQTGLISPSQREGGKRLYTFRDLVALRTLKELLDAGAPLQRIRRCLEQLRAQLPRLLGPAGGPQLDGGPAPHGGLGEASPAASQPPAGQALQSLGLLRVICHGDRLVVVGPTGPFEPDSGQILFQFAIASLSEELARVLPLLPPTLASRATGLEAPGPAAGGPAEARPGEALDPAPSPTAHAWFLEASRLTPSQPGGGPGGAGEPLPELERPKAGYERALQLDPGLAAAHTNLGNVRHLGGDAVGALACYERALELDEDQPEARYNRAGLLEQRGEAAAAQSEYRQVLLRAPDFADAHFNLARLLERTGQPALARVHWAAYLELCPQGEGAVEARARLEEAALLQRVG